MVQFLHLVWAKTGLLKHLYWFRIDDRYSCFGKRLLAITTMNAELPPFKNGERNSERASTLDRDITPLIDGTWKLAQH